MHDRLGVCASGKNWHHTHYYNKFSCTIFFFFLNNCTRYNLTLTDRNRARSTQPHALIGESASREDASSSRPRTWMTSNASTTSRHRDGRVPRGRTSELKSPARIEEHYIKCEENGVRHQCISYNYVLPHYYIKLKSISISQLFKIFKYQILLRIVKLELNLLTIRSYIFLIRFPNMSSNKKSIILFMLTSHCKYRFVSKNEVKVPSQCSKN
ncbi:hypothetical protein PUN28_007190 [Cardiocondyla obscurior]|uniref:Uncharacterized protein n=1 Tax=Cardiocondyla obscurior TaxID=286306 RepID=A0AAW2G4B0_9HYME